MFAVLRLSGACAKLTSMLYDFLMANISLFFCAAATAIILAAGLVGWGSLKKCGTKGEGVPLCANTPKAPKSRARSLKRETTTCLFQPEKLPKSTH